MIAAPGAGGGPVLEFAYHRSIVPTLGVLLAIVETIVVHIVAVALWGWRVAIALGLLDLSLVVALLALLASIRRHPVTLGDGIMTMRLGRKAIAVPLDRVRGLRDQWDAAALKRKDVANFALASWPNVMIDVDPPVTVRGRAVSAVAHKLDDPAAFARALGTIGGGDGRG